MHLAIAQNSKTCLKSSLKIVGFALEVALFSLSVSVLRNS